MIDNQMIDTIQSLNKQYGRELTLDELLEIESKTHIFNRIASNNNFRKEIDEFMLVHVTDYAPMDNAIKTPKQTGMELKKETPIGEIETKSFRDTVHFTVNTTVSSHGYGDWSERKYAIFIPMDSFVEKNGQNIKSCQVVDFFIKGQANLPNDSYLLCPQDEVEQIKKENPNINVIGYQGKNVIEYTEKFLKMLEIRTKECGAWSYIDDDEKDFHTQKKLQELLSQKLGKNIPYVHHNENIESEKEGIFQNLSTVFSAVNNIKKNKLFDRLPKEILERYLVVIEPNSEWNWEDNNVSKEELQELANQVNIFSIPLGISVLQFYGNKKIKNDERIYESLEIDNFTGKDIAEVFESDMLITNIKRISLILDKIDNEKSYNDKNTINILILAIKHLQEDYRITLEEVDIRKKYDDKFDLKGYQKKLDERLITLGINHKYLEKKNLHEIILQEHQNQQFIKKNFPSPKEDYILNIISILNNLDDLIYARYQMMIKNNLDDDKIFSQALYIYRYLSKKIEMDLEEDYIIQLKKNDMNIEEYLKKMEQILNKLGVSINDFMKEDRKENDISEKMNKNIEKKLRSLSYYQQNNNEIVEVSSNKR